MTAATLTIDLNAVVANWRALDAMSASNVETAAVVKADGYGLGVERVSTALTKAGARSFFVALAEEGVALRKSVGNDPAIYVFSGLMATDAALIGDYNLIPLLNSPSQLVKFRMGMPEAPFGIQIDTGMNRLGLEPADFMMVREKAKGASLIISHLACANAPEHPKNDAQLQCFDKLTKGMSARRSLAATGGTLLGPDYHFDLCRPGIGLYGCEPFTKASPVVTISVPVIQTRNIAAGETVGYSAAWTAQRPTKVATVAAGYADGLFRAMGSGKTLLWAGNTPCPVIGRVSMDLITVDVTDVPNARKFLDILNAQQTIDKLADNAGTIGYEILTSLGARYKRDYVGG
jgi:alanine racemase